MALTDTVPATLLARANTINFSTEEKSRREGALLNKDFYYSRQEDSLDLVNLDVDPITVNLTHPIVNKKVSLLYSRPLVREFDGPKKSAKLLEAIYSVLNIDQFLQSVDLAAELTGTGLIFVGISDEGDIELRLYDASEFSAVANSETANTVAEAISIITISTSLNKGPTKAVQMPTVKQDMVSEIWMDDFVVKMVNGKRTTTRANDLGFLPFVPFKGEEVYNQYIGHAPANIIRMMNKYINQMHTNLGYMIKMQSATPIVLSGFQNGEGVVVHPGKALSLPAGATATALQLNPKIDDTLKSIALLEEKLYETSGIPKVSVIGDADSQSGRELMIKWAPLLGVFKDKALRYTGYELELANMILKVVGEEEIDNVVIHYPEEAVLPVGPSIDEIESEIRLGLITPVDAILQKQPTLDELEAEALVRANIDFNAAFYGDLEEPEEEVNETGGLDGGDEPTD
jgi:hypothetical protein